MSDALDELRKKYFTKVEPDPAAPKVFHIFSKAPFDPEKHAAAEKPKRLRKPKLDKNAIELVSDLVEDFKAGTLHGCCLIAWNTQEKRLEQHVVLPPGRTDHEAALLFSGGAQMLNQALQDVAEFGMENMREANEVEIIEGELPEDWQ